MGHQLEGVPQAAVAQLLLDFVIRNAGQRVVGQVPGEGDVRVSGIVDRRQPRGHGGRLDVAQGGGRNEVHFGIDRRFKIDGIDRGDIVPVLGADLQIGVAEEKSARRGQQGVARISRLLAVHLVISRARARVDGGVPPDVDRRHGDLVRRRPQVARQGGRGAIDGHRVGVGGPCDGSVPRHVMRGAHIHLEADTALGRAVRDMVRPGADILEGIAVEVLLGVQIVEQVIGRFPIFIDRKGDVGLAVRGIGADGEGIPVLVHRGDDQRELMGGHRGRQSDGHAVVLGRRQSVIGRVGARRIAGIVLHHQLVVVGVPAGQARVPEVIDVALDLELVAAGSESGAEVGKVARLVMLPDPVGRVGREPRPRRGPVEGVEFHSRPVAGVGVIEHYGPAQDDGVGFNVIHRQVGGPQVRWRGVGVVGTGSRGRGDVGKIARLGGIVQIQEAVVVEIFHERTD